MALQTDCDLAAVTAAIQWDTVNFNDTFDNAPVDTVVMATEDKKKSALQEGQVGKLKLPDVTCVTTRGNK